MSDSHDRHILKCELCERRLPSILIYSWPRPQEFGGTLKVCLCFKCEKEFKRITQALQAKATKTLNEDYEQWLNNTKKEKQLEQNQLKLPVV